MLLNNYYLNYPEIESQEDLMNFLIFAEKNYTEFDYIRKEKNNYDLEFDSIKKCIIIKTNGKVSKLDLKLEIGIPDRCQNSISMEGILFQKLFRVGESK